MVRNRASKALARPCSLPGSANDLSDFWLVLSAAAVLIKANFEYHVLQGKDHLWMALTARKMINEMDSQQLVPGRYSIKGFD